MKNEGARIIELPKVHEKRGKLAVIEKNMIPFQIKRVYYLYDIPTNAYRGVITSYSIHYTKLYDTNDTRRNRHV